MINDMKLGIRFLRYGYGIKTNLVLLAVCVVFDALFFALEFMGITVPLDGYFLLACGMVPTQLLFSLNAVNFVLSSPVRKKLQTSVPAVLNWFLMLGVYLIIVLKKAVVALIHPDKIAQNVMGLLFLASLAALVMAFTGVLYKSFPAFIGMCFSLSGFISFFMLRILQWDLLGKTMASFVYGTVIGTLLITAGAAAQYALSVLFYKRPVSKKTLGAQLNRQL